MARTAKRQLKGWHLLFGEYLQSWTTLNVHYESIEDELNIDGGKHVLAMFLNKEVFWMNNKTIYYWIRLSYHMKTYWVLQYCSKVSYQSVSSCSRLQGFIINFLKNIFTSVLAPQIAIASLGGSGMVRKENNCSKVKVKKVESKGDSTVFK